MYYKLIVSKFESKKDSALCVNVNINEGREPVQVLRLLAQCFREANKNTRKNPAITIARAWEAYDAIGAPVYKFSFRLHYDDNNTYIYEYEFQGCGLE